MKQALKKSLKILLAVLLAIIAAILLIYASLNCGIASAIAESMIGKKTGCEMKISGFHINPVREFPAFEVSVDSVYMTDVRDSSLDIRVRGVRGRAEFRKDSIFASFSSSRNFLRFGPNRIILRDIVLSSEMDMKDSTPSGAGCSLDIGGGKFISTMFPLRTRINAVSFSKKGDCVYIDSLSLTGGTTQINLSGYADKLAGYLSGDGELDVVLDIKSGNVNVNEILSGIYYGTADERRVYSPAEEEDESFIVVDKYIGYPFKIKEIVPLIIPDRLRVSADLDVKKATVSILSMSDFSSHLDVEDRTGKASGIKFDSNIGKVSATFFYWSPSKEKLLAGVDMQLRKLTAGKIATLLPPKMRDVSSLLNSFKGEFSCNATMISRVDTAFVPILPSLKGVVNFKGDKLCITDAGGLRKYTSMLMFRNKNIGDIDDLNLYAIATDDKIKIFPMILGVDRYQLAMTGSHTFENAFDYDISVLKSPVPFKFGFNLHCDGGKSKVKFKLKNATYRDANIPKYYSEVSQAHKLLGETIDNVLKEGADVTASRSSRITRELFDKHKNIRATSLDGGDDSSISDSIKTYFPSQLDSLKNIRSARKQAGNRP